MNPIVTSNPVNRSHPLNVGREAWWLALPHLAAGPTFYDLMGFAPGTLAAAGNTRQQTTRPGGYGEIAFDGTSGQVLTAANPIPTLTAFTVAAWVRPAFSSTDTGFYSVLNRQGMTGDDRVGRIFWLGSSGGWYSDGNSNYGLTSNNPGFAAGSWHRIMFSYSGGFVGQFFWDGHPIVTSLSNGGSPTPNVTTGFPFWIGGEVGVTYPWHGSIDDVSVWSRAFTFQDAAQDFELSRRGYPGALNRYRSVSMFAVTTATAGPTFRRNLGLRAGSRGVA